MQNNQSAYGLVESVFYLNGSYPFETNDECFLNGEVQSTQQNQKKDILYYYSVFKLLYKLHFVILNINIPDWPFKPFPSI